MVDDVPVAEYGFSINGPEVTFTNNSVNADSYEWNFNDGSGTISTDENPFYIFPGVGDFEVTMIATNACGSMTFTETISITSPTSSTENESPVLQFFAAPNPFSNQTKVSYELGRTFENGQIILTNVLGEIVAQQNISAQQGQLVVGDEIVQDGVYFLQLVLDGERRGILKVLKF